MIQVMMIHARAEIVAVAVVAAVVAKVEQTLLKLRVRIPQHHQRKILKNPRRIVAVAVDVQRVKALFLVKQLKKMA
jgi:hypothetical protein